jgi:hypothetical protein
MSQNHSRVELGPSSAHHLLKYVLQLLGGMAPTVLSLRINSRRLTNAMAQQTILNQCDHCLCQLFYITWGDNPTSLSVANYSRFSRFA